MMNSNIGNYWQQDEYRRSNANRHALLSDSSSSSSSSSDVYSSLDIAPSSSSSSSSASFFEQFCSQFRPNNALFWPLLVLFSLFILFFSLTIYAFTLAASSSSFSSSTLPASAALIGSPLLLPDPVTDWQTFTILAMNDIYEMLPLSEGRRGGLARCATIRKMLREENEKTLTVFAGDLLSPSAFSAVSFNGSLLAGRQMIASMNALGLDIAVTGNHEFDVSAADLVARVSESSFPWIAANVFVNGSTNVLFPPATLTSNFNTGFVIRNMNGVRVLMIGSCINSNFGSGHYVDILNDVDSIARVKSIIAQQSALNSFDIVIAINHFAQASDVLMAESIPQLSLIIGGHEHANIKINRGLNFVPITRADSNDATVYIHRFAFNHVTKQVLLQSHLQIVNENVPSDAAVQAVAELWFNRGVAALEAVGFKPNNQVIVLPSGIIWDGRSEIVRSDRNNLLNQMICNSLMAVNSSLTNGINPIAAIHNSGSVRVDDILEGAITEFDVLRILPFSNYVQVINTTGASIFAALNSPSNAVSQGGFLSYCGAITWQSNGVYSLNNQPLSSSDSNWYLISTSDYLATGAGNIFPSFSVLYNGATSTPKLLMSQQFIQFLNSSDAF